MLLLVPLCNLLLKVEPLSDRHRIPQLVLCASYDHCVRLLQYPSLLRLALHRLPSLSRYPVLPLLGPHVQLRDVHLLHFGFCLHLTDYTHMIPLL